MNVPASALPPRRATRTRQTRETQIRVELTLEAQRRTQHRGDGLLLRRGGRFGLAKRGDKPRDSGCVHLCLLMIRDCARFNARRGRRDLRVRFATSQPQLLQELARSVGIPFRLRH